MEHPHMEDLVLVKKISQADALANKRTGRPKRQGFALRNYSKAVMVALPYGISKDGDKIDFYLSSTGFAIKIGPECSRAISGKKSSKTVSVPVEVRKRLEFLPEGSRPLVSDEMPGNMFFFPFGRM